MKTLNGKKIEPIIKYSFYSKMYQLIDVLDMKEGEMYFIRRRDYIRELIFVEYQTSADGKPFAVFTFPNCPGYTCPWLNNISVYRYIIEEEYKTKFKEKYISKCLDIVLKRLINGSFA